MDIVHERAAGMDISKRDAKVCVRVPGARAGTYTSKVTTWGATTQSILELREFLESEHVTVVVMEASSDYWKPFFYLLEETLPVMLVNAKAASVCANCLTPCSPVQTPWLYGNSWSYRVEAAGQHFDAIWPPH